MTTKKIGLALGGGGARGYAHLSVLEAFDEMGIRPHQIAGTSIGAVMGAIYAAGVSAADLRNEIREATLWKEDRFRDLMKKKRLFQWFKLMHPEWKRGGIVRSDKAIDAIIGELRVSSFEELEIPLRVAATDIWRGEEMIFETGPLAPAVRASLAIPGVFAPVQHEDRLLVDGGVLNLIPTQLLDPDCDVVIAVNVSGLLLEDRCDPLRMVDVLTRTIDVMQYGSVRQSLETRPPDKLIRANVGKYLISDFHKAESILHDSAALKHETIAYLQEIA